MNKKARLRVGSCQKRRFFLDKIQEFGIMMGIVIDKV